MSRMSKRCESTVSSAIESTSLAVEVIVFAKIVGQSTALAMAGNRETFPNHKIQPGKGK